MKRSELQRVKGKERYWKIPICDDDDEDYTIAITPVLSTEEPDCPDCEDSQFCHSSRVSHPQLHLGIRYPNLID
ncbi:hypothetical protein Tco_0385395 [Tanacetum coccineum]